MKSFVLKVTYVTHSLTELSRTGKVGNSFIRFSVTARLWNHPELVNIFAYCYCGIETQHKLTENNHMPIFVFIHARVLTSCLFAASDHVLGNVLMVISKHSKCNVP